MPFTLSAKAKQNTLSKEIDSTVLSNFYKTASVDFSKSNPRKSDCFKEYILNGNMKSEEVQMHLSLNPCDSLVHIEDIIIVH